MILNRGEQYVTKYSIFFDDVPIRVSKLQCDKKYTHGWSDETQKDWIESGGVKFNNHIFYGVFAIHQNEYIVTSPKVAEELFNITEKVYKEDKRLIKLKKIKDEINPGADLID